MATSTQESTAGVQESTLATRWKDLEKHRRRAASRAVGDTAADPEATLFLTWGKHKGVSFTQAWLDESYVKWCCEHMHIQEVSGNRLAWLHFLSVRIAAEVEALETLYPDTASRTGSESAAENGTSRHLAALEARMLIMERVMMRVLAAVSDSTPSSEEPSPEGPSAGGS